MKTKLYFLCLLVGMGLFIACSDGDDAVKGDPAGTPNPEIPSEVLTTLRFDKKINGEELDNLEYETNAAGQTGLRTWDLRTVGQPSKKGAVGDSIHADTVRLYLSVAGEAPKEKKEIFFKVAALKDQNDPGRVANLEILGNCYLEAGATSDSITVVLHYPTEKARDYEGGLYIDTEKSKVAVIDEGALFKFTLKYEWEKPATWTEENWGEYSQDKHGFIITVLGTYNNWNSSMSAAWARTPLKNWVNKYGHPEGFTIPGVWE